MTEYIPSGIRREVFIRAHARCEYCLMPEDHVVLPHEPDHIISLKHGGITESENLALACFLCNRFKGSDVASVDTESDRVVRLFHPRRDAWQDHFVLSEDGRIGGLTDVGRVTVQLLRINLPESVATRRELMQRKMFSE